ncbi:MAG: hypothetical protein LBT05_06565 [Planctomycetaceae bacterium]|nr:hypothetical protein [Planctomycetaceae bacterium]
MLNENNEVEIDGVVWRLRKMPDLQPSEKTSMVSHFGTTFPFIRNRR